MASSGVGKWNKTERYWFIHLKCKKAPDNLKLEKDWINNRIRLFSNIMELNCFNLNNLSIIILEIDKLSQWMYIIITLPLYTYRWGTTPDHGIIHIKNRHIKRVEEKMARIIFLLLVSLAKHNYTTNMDPYENSWGA